MKYYTKTVCRTCEDDPTECETAYIVIDESGETIWDTTNFDMVRDYFIGKIEKRDGETYYIHTSGREYPVGEVVCPSGSTYDIGVILDYSFDDLSDFCGIVNHFFGISLMDDDELAETCAHYVDRYEKEHVLPR